MTLILGERAFVGCPKLRRFGTSDTSKPDTLLLSVPGAVNIGKAVFDRAGVQKLLVSSPQQIIMNGFVGITTVNTQNNTIIVYTNVGEALTQNYTILGDAIVVYDNVSGPLTEQYTILGNADIIYNTINSQISQDINAVGTVKIISNNNQSSGEITLGVASINGLVILDSLRQFISLGISKIPLYSQGKTLDSVFSTATRLQSLYIAVSSFYEITTFMSIPTLKKLRMEFPSVINIPVMIFADNSHIEELALVGTVNTIGDYAFTNLSSLKRLQIGNIADTVDVSAIERGAFYKCSQLATVKFTDKLTKIGDFAFMDTGITGEVVIPKNVIEHGVSYFLRCNKITKLIYLCNLIEFNDPTYIYPYNLGALTTIANPTIDFEINGKEIIYFNGKHTGPRVATVNSISRNLAAECQVGYSKSQFELRKQRYEAFISALYDCNDSLQAIITTVEDNASYKTLSSTLRDTISSNLGELEQNLELFIDETQEDVRLARLITKNLAPPNMNELNNILFNGGSLYRLVKLISTNIPSLKTRVEQAFSDISTHINNPKQTIGTTLLGSILTILSSPEFTSFEASNPIIGSTIRSLYESSVDTVLSLAAKYIFLLGNRTIYDTLFASSGILPPLDKYDIKYEISGYTSYLTIRGYKYGIEVMGRAVTVSNLEDEQFEKKILNATNITNVTKNDALAILKSAEDIISKYQFIISNLNNKLLLEPLTVTLKKNIDANISALSASVSSGITTFKTKCDNATSIITSIKTANDSIITTRGSDNDKADTIIPITFNDTSLKITLDSTSIEDYIGNASIVSVNGTKYMRYSSKKDDYTDIVDVAELKLSNESAFYVDGSIQFNLAQHYSSHHIKILEDVLTIINGGTYDNKNIDFEFIAPKYIKIQSLKGFSNSNIRITAPIIIIACMAMKDLISSNVSLTSSKRLTIEDRAFDAAENLILNIKVARTGKVTCGREIFYCSRYVTINTNKELISTSTTPIILNTLETTIWDKNLLDVLLIVEAKIKETNPSFDFTNTYDVKYTTFTAQDNFSPIFAISYRTYADHREYDIIIPPMDYFWASTVGKFTSDVGGALSPNNPLRQDFTYGDKYFVYYPDTSVKNMGRSLPGYRYRETEYSKDYYGLQNNFAPSSFIYKGIRYDRKTSVQSTDPSKRVLQQVSVANKDAIEEEISNKFWKDFAFAMAIVDLVLMIIPIVGQAIVLFRASSLAIRLSSLITNISMKISSTIIRISSVISRVFRITKAGTIIKMGDEVKILKNATHITSIRNGVASAARSSRLGMAQRGRFKMTTLADELNKITYSVGTDGIDAVNVIERTKSIANGISQATRITFKSAKSSVSAVKISRPIKQVGLINRISGAEKAATSLSNVQKPVQKLEHIFKTAKKIEGVLEEIEAILIQGKKATRITQKTVSSAIENANKSSEMIRRISTKKINLPTPIGRRILSESELSSIFYTIVEIFINDITINNMENSIARNKALSTLSAILIDQTDEYIDSIIQTIRFVLNRDSTSITSQRDYIQTLVTQDGSIYSEFILYPLKHIAMYSLMNNIYMQGASSYDEQSEFNVPETTPAALSIESSIDDFINNTFSYKSPPFVASSKYRNRFTPDKPKWLVLDTYINRGILGKSDEPLKRDSKGKLNSPCLYAHPLMSMDEYLWPEISLKPGFTINADLTGILYIPIYVLATAVQIELKSQDKQPDLFSENYHSSRLYFGKHYVEYNTNTEAINNYVFSGSADNTINYTNYGVGYESITSLSPYCFSSGLFEDTSTIPFNISSITLPEGITTIPNSAFYRAGISSITLPASLYRIGQSAFTQAGLSSVSFNFLNLITQYPSGTAYIKLKPFNVTKLTYLDVRNKELIAEYNRAIKYKAIANIIIKNPESITINGRTISDIDTIQLTNTTFYIYDYYGGSIINSIFDNTNPQLTITVIEGNITASQFTIGNNIQRDISITARAIEDSIDINENAFSGNTELTIIEFPPTLRTIGDGAFAGCTALTTVTLPPLKAIGDNVFADCTALTQVTLPPNIESIGAKVFENCPALTTIKFEGKPPASIDPGFFTNIALLSNPITIVIPPKYAPALINAIKSSGISLGSSSTNITLAVDMNGITPYFPMFLSPSTSRVKESLFVYSSAAMESLKANLVINPATKYVSWLTGGAAYDGMLIRPLGRKIHIYTTDRRPLLKYVFMNIQLLSTAIVPALTDREPYLTGWVCTFSADGIYPQL